MENVTLGLNLSSVIAEKTTLFNIEWLIGLLIVGITLIFITRKPKEWADLALPVFIGWWLCGVKFGIGGFIILGITFTIIMIIDVMGIDLVGETIRSRLRRKEDVFEQERVKARKSVVREKERKRILGLSEDEYNEALTGRANVATMGLERAREIFKKRKEGYREIKMKGRAIINENNINNGGRRKSK